MGAKSQVGIDNRAVVYIDGFNLYHPLVELGDNRLKWLNLWRLSERICQDRGHALMGVNYCTAFQRNNPAQLQRHQTYISALEAVGVQTTFGHYIMADSKPCSGCGQVTSHPNEKQTDINLALSVFADAMNDRFDWAYLLSADSDQAATARFLKKHFPEKKLVTVVPPGKPLSKNIMNYADGKRNLNEDDIAKCRFENYVKCPDGKIVRVPREYE